MTINEQYDQILSKSKFIARPDVWFVEGTEAKLENNNYGNLFNEKCKFKDGCGLFIGLTNETYIGYDGVLPREDGETCPFDEFFIYDELGIEISELTMEKYFKLQFTTLTQKWNEETMLISNPQDIFNNIHHQQIIQLGTDIIPLIIEDWKTTDNHWFGALYKLTGHNPIKKENRGYIRKMKQDWLDYLNSLKQQN